MMLRLFVLAIGAGLVGCGTNSRSHEGPDNYDWDNPIKFYMPDRLLEVSGISLLPGSNDSLLAQQDELGRVFLLKAGEKKYRDIRFADDGDFEDLTILQDQVFVLKSEGSIFNFLLSSFTTNEKEIAATEWLNSWGKGEYEGLYARPDEKSLYLLCKECDDSKGDLLIKKLDVDSFGLKLQGEIRIASDSVSRHLQDGEIKGKKLQPSGLAQHPISGDWYIISHVNKLLIIADEGWRVKSAWPLSPTRFRQPEGICFAPNGDLFISNEGDEVSSGNVLKFHFQYPAGTR
ncbi:MAG: hypothetical protein ACK4E0_18460 [Chitinophagaceae bacterium]